MDEAHGVGEGRYRQLYGYKEGTEIFVEHLQKVNEICQRSDLQPMIWSDSKFCILLKRQHQKLFIRVSSAILFR
jgi:hypothetical protein